ncbi:hypothetical protein SDC9_185671 [bioreactor metagenome]|uniref:Uncharacterized protein n=1 Tax=bioreactor metagenome TaxID=1076179 RepID=A0A645HGR6_9ZZZZ
MVNLLAHGQGPVIPERSGSPSQGHTQPLRHGKSGECIQSKVHAKYWQGYIDALSL